jgi:hypothetical protein
MKICRLGLRRPQVGVGGLNVNIFQHEKYIPYHLPIFSFSLRKNQMYDEYGRLLDDLRDLCDCLVEECDGCHFPCTKCKSTKCGIDCRMNRRYVYDQVEIEGSRTVINFSDTLEPISYFK